MGSSETVARLVHSNIYEPDIAAFTRKELTGAGIPVISDLCGEADGCSVDRADGLSDDELKARSEAQAGSSPNRVAKGARIADVAALRAIGHKDARDGQAVRIYDDPRPANDRHAVLRVCAAIPRPDFLEVRRQIVAAFARQVG